MKESLSEQEIRTRFITPAIQEAGWKPKQVREEYPFTKGRIRERGSTHSRAKPKRADYVLFRKANLPLAIVEAKDNTHSVGAGMQQALDYADRLDVPFVYSSNGDGFIEHDRISGEGEIERELTLSAFPSPAQLWTRYRRAKGLTEEQQELVLQDYHTEIGGKTPRYYQRVAINRTIEAIAKGKDRLLLVMATGTGKTYTAFQIIWRLWKAREMKRVLFLADRNILVDQAMRGDFRPFGEPMTKIQNRQADKAYEIYMALYQAVSGAEERQNIYRDYSPDFFDLVVIDECHRGSARENSAWREILDYFEPAVQLGLTATPKETAEVSNQSYFGEPVYTYSLKQGIQDGFLAPYRVVRVGLDRDLEGWRPEKGKRDKFGREVEDRKYNQRDFDRNLVIDERTRRVAEKVSEYLKDTDRYAQTIVFCEDIDHAERMRRALINENADLYRKSERYVVRITGDSDEGRRELDHFIDPESRYPVIATTSEMLTTGVDAQTCKLIVLDRNIRSMAHFKQIIGRGTRVREDYGKRSFTIMDFRRATDKFADPDFDGEPEQIYEPDEGDSPAPPDDGGNDGREEDSEGGGEGRKKYYVNEVPVRVVNERVQYLDAGGRLITESLTDYTKKSVREHYASLDDFLQDWREADRKAAIIEELETQGVFFEELKEEVGKDLGAFDLICHVAFDQPPLTRHERAENVRKTDYFGRYGEEARAVLEALLDKYADEGIEDMESMNVLQVRPLSEMGGPLELVGRFGSKVAYQTAVRELEQQIYQAA